MPQASEPHRAIMQRWFGTMDCGSVLEFLASRGYSETRGGIVMPPTKWHRPNSEEYVCLHFLVNEWDYDFHVELPYDY